MLSRNLALLWVLLLTSFSAFAQQDPAFWPWRLGMSKQQVVSYVEQGPYNDVAPDNLETAGAIFASHKVKATLAFGTAGLASIKLHNYEGKDGREAHRIVLEVFDQFTTKYGGARVKDISDILKRDEFDLLLRLTLDTAEEMNRQYTPKREYMVLTFDMVPLKQPMEGRLHCQWIFNGRDNTYSIFLYQDLPSAPKRDVASNMVIYGIAGQR